MNPRTSVAPNAIPKTITTLVCMCVTECLPEVPYSYANSIPKTVERNIILIGQVHEDAFLRG
jgi:hypothetical protein